MSRQEPFARNVGVRNLRKLCPKLSIISWIYLFLF